MHENEKVIPFEGNYWWGDAERVIQILEEELKEALNETRISTIQIRGSDFNDGRQTHTVEIEISNNKVRVIKKYV